MILYVRPSGPRYAKITPLSVMGRLIVSRVLSVLVGFFVFSVAPCAEAAAAQAARIDEHLSYFNGLLVVFGFVIGVWLTVILLVAITWYLNKTGRREKPKNKGRAEDAEHRPAQSNNGCAEPAEDPLLLKIGLLRDVLKGITAQVEKFDPSAPPEIARAQAAKVQTKLEGLLVEADTLVIDITDEVCENASYERGAESCALDSVSHCAADSPEHAEMHVRARNLRAEGCRLLEEDKNKDALCRFEESLGLLQELAKADPENQLWKRDLVLSYHNLGRTMEALGMYKESFDYFNEALNITRKLVDQNPGSLDWKRGLAASHSHVGRVSASLGNLDGAWKNFDKEIDVLNYMLNKQPDNKSWQYALASAYHNMGQLLERRGQKRDALDVYKKDQAILKKLMGSDPNNTVWLYDLACVHGQMARMYKEQGRLKDALSNARRYLGAMRKLSEREPGNIGHRRELTVALGQVGRLLELRGEYDQALTTFNATLEIRRNLAEMDPDNAVWQDDLLVCLYKMGDVYFAQKEYDEAWQYYQEALDLVENLIMKDGQANNWMMAKCGVLLRLGNLHQVQDTATADNYYRSALSIAQQPHQGDSKDGDWRELAGLIKRNMTQQEAVITH